MGKGEISIFRNKLCAIFEQIEGELPQIQNAARAITDAYAAGAMVHVIGPGGHSNIGVEEVLWRAGGLAMWDAILDPGTNLIHGAKRSNYIERTPGYALGVLNAYGVGKTPGEVMVIVNAYGINAMTIDTVLECKKRGVTTVAVTSSSFAKIVPAGAKSRHPSRKNLYEEADIFIDNHLPLGDAVVTVGDYDQKVCSTSTFCNCFVMNCLTEEVVSEMLRRGIEPPVFMSANMPGGDEHNRALEEKYGGVIKHLL
ncbi:MAG TPA: sugar isomerase domain-containing protein [Eubacteriales bacterium]|nr:sugar isomerase domain-containing protein [Eubacteriales bacterium]